MRIKKFIKRVFWALPVSNSLKLKIVQQREKAKEDNTDDLVKTENINEQYSIDYTYQILQISSNSNSEKVDFIKHESNVANRALLIAYYLTQYHPTKENNLWWGKGTTEWTNVTKAVPQYIGHYQPRLAGELGYYDLRLKENIAEQVDIAKNYGIGAFAFYYYWFNGRRVLEKPLNLFLQDKNIDMQFCLCWANENWTKRFTSDNNEVTLFLDDNPETYKRFIHDVMPELSDKRYLTIDDKLVLIIYRPSLVPDAKLVLDYWRSYVKDSIGRELFIIASQEKGVDIDWTKVGFDDMSQFQPASLNDGADLITEQKHTICKDFSGKIYDYSSIISKNIMLPKKRMFPAVMPMWDNTPRRGNKAVIYDESTIVWQMA